MNVLEGEHLLILKLLLENTLLNGIGKSALFGRWEKENLGKEKGQRS